MNVALSIDWDFFFNYNPYNWVYAENEFFKTHVWNLRLLMQPDLVKKFIPKGYKEFWPKLREKQLVPKTVYVAEHHLYAYYVFRDVVTLDLILHFDNHSDMSVREYKIDSGNWLRQLMKLRHGLRVIWVKPDYCKGEELAKTGMLDRFKQINWCDFDRIELSDAKVLSSYICHSGTWTPPWSDKGFKDFLKGSESRVVPITTSPVYQRLYHLPDSNNFWSRISKSKAVKLGLEVLKCGLKKTKLGPKATKREPVV